MDEERKYYVYMYLRTNGTPYYVGKGTGDRAYNKYRTIKPPKDLSRIIFHAQNLTEEEAFAIEIEQIKKYGRVDNDTGILRNLTDGGEGTSGRIASEEDIAKMIAAVKESMKRPEVRSKMSAASKELNNRPEVKEKFIERMNRPEVKAKIRAILNIPEVKEKHIATVKESINRPEVRAKKSASLKAFYASPEARAKKSAEMKAFHASSEAMNRPEVRAKMSAAAKKRHARERAEKLADQANLQSFLEEPSTQLDTVAEKQQS